LVPAPIRQLTGNLGGHRVKQSCHRPRQRLDLLGRNASAAQRVAWHAGHHHDWWLGCQVGAQRGGRETWRVASQQRQRPPLPLVLAVAARSEPLHDASGSHRNLVRGSPAAHEDRTRSVDGMPGAGKVMAGEHEVGDDPTDNQEDHDPHDHDSAG
jgi:hypothetical protein